ncbi:class A beta-lactamase-related serine hydrolase [bacterium]|nr:MAG: class A beta-lactamase-related serine hydrolase [bacterium]
MLPLFLPVTQTPPKDKVSELILREMKRLKTPGLTLTVVRNGKLVRKGAYGLSDVELNVKADYEDVFEIGSITKQFTAAGLLLLVEDGKLSLDDPVGKWLDDVPAAWKDIQLRSLAHQTSGIPDYAFVPGLGIVENFDRATWMTKMAALPMDFPTGVAWGYSNSNYALLGWVIEKASGQPYTKFMGDRVLKPLGLTKTKFADGLPVTRRAHGYLFNEGKLYLSTPMGGSIQSDGTLLSTAGDMAKWDAAIRTRKLLKPTSYDEWFSPARLASGRTRPYGMGWFLAAPKMPAYNGHGGNSSGYGAGIARFDKDKLTVIVLTNVYPFPGEALARSVAEVIDPSLKPTTPVPIATDPDPARTERVKAAIAALAANNPDETLLEPEVSAPMLTERAKRSTAFAPLAKLDSVLYCGATPEGRDTWLTYRIKAGDRSWTALLLWSNENKLAQIVLRRA